jgi:hypothetical protein
MTGPLFHDCLMAKLRSTSLLAMAMQPTHEPHKSSRRFNSLLNWQEFLMRLSWLVAFVLVATLPLPASGQTRISTVGGSGFDYAADLAVAPGGDLLAR